MRYSIIPARANDFNIVAVRIEDERAVVIRKINGVAVPAPRGFSLSRDDAEILHAIE
jgi:hypothetical protein